MRSKILASAPAAVAVIILAMVFLAVPTTRVENANAYFQPTNIRSSGLVGTKTLALTFDDGPSAFTAELLDVLAENNIKATFFVLGTRARHHDVLIARMVREGHVVANHSYNHAQLGRRYAASPELLVDQIGRTDALISVHAGSGQGYYFRAPYGVWRRVHADVLNADPVLKKYVGPVYWDIGGETSFDDEGEVRASADWDCWSRDWTPDMCGKGYMREIARKRGGIVLMHDIRERTVRMVSTMLPVLVAEGYKFVTLDEIRALDQFKTPSGEDVPVADAGSPSSNVLMAH
ncbi:MAG: polysaccharide deacetylase family protein [Alphaproteobacteria bacterium]|jgi:peptidoglycan/xylan/chitin deacetylase (PgdA/CDA1 family)